MERTTERGVRHIEVGELPYEFRPRVRVPRASVNRPAVASDTAEREPMHREVTIGIGAAPHDEWRDQDKTLRIFEARMLVVALEAAIALAEAEQRKFDAEVALLRETERARMEPPG